MGIFNKSSKVGKFDKVSYKEFQKMMDKLTPFSGNSEFVKKIYDEIELPTRATKGSAGYDFKAPFGFELKPNESIIIPTGIRAKMNNRYVLQLFPRSGLGSRYRLQLDNTVGIIDSDYYYSDNEGHIMAKITNCSLEDKTVEVSSGQGFMQGVFIPFGITSDDNTKTKRNGGFGSTDKR